MHVPSEHLLLPLSQIMDPRSALKRLGNDADLFDQIIHIAIEDGPELVQASQQALESGDLKGLRRSAHSLRSLMATLSANSAANAAHRLEQCAAGDDCSQAPELIENCRVQVGEVTAALRTYCVARQSAPHDGQGWST